MIGDRYLLLMQHTSTKMESNVAMEYGVPLHCRSVAEALAEVATYLRWQGLEGAEWHAVRLISAIFEPLVWPAEQAPSSTQPSPRP